MKINRYVVAMASGLLLIAGQVSVTQAADSKDQSTREAMNAPTDPQIAAIVVAANQVDIDAGKMAKTKASDPQVKSFANMMVVDHSAANKSASDLVKKIEVKPKSNEISKSLMSGGKQNMASLRKLKGAEFDKAYIDHEVEYHQAVLDTIDQTLLPNAKNDQLKALIEKIRPTIAAHLEQAQNVAQALAQPQKMQGT